MRLVNITRDGHRDSVTQTEQFKALCVVWVSLFLKS